MSNYYKKITTSQKHQNLQFVNTLVGNHDLYCFCNEPLQHIICSIIEQEPNLKFNKEDSQKIQKCLTTGQDPAGDAVDALGEGDLDALFAQDTFGEEDTG